MSTTTEIGTYMFPRNSRRFIDYVSIDSEHGCDVNCCCLHTEGEILIGNASGIHIADETGVTKEFPILGKKKYVIMVKNSAVVGSFDDNGQQVVTVLDLHNEFMEYGVTLFRNGKNEYISYILRVWGTIFVVTRTHTVFSLTEKDLQTKLKSLYERHQYEIALSVAQSNQMDYNGILDIHRM